MTFYRYLEDCDVHVLDCAGKVDVPVGLARLRRLSDELEARPGRDGIHRLLIDFRHTVWASEAAHRELSQVTRRTFGFDADNPALRLAFVFQHGKGTVSNSERWFEDDAEALAWLAATVVAYLPHNHCTRASPRARVASMGLTKLRDRLSSSAGGRW